MYNHPNSASMPFHQKQKQMNFFVVSCENLRFPKDFIGLCLLSSSFFIHKTMASVDQYALFSDDLVSYLKSEPLLALSICFTVLYFVMIVLVKPSNTVNVKRLSAIHYLFLVGLSAVMFLGGSWAIAQVYMRTGSFSSTICVPFNSTLESELKMWIAIFHVSKYWELLDTTLSLLKGSGASKLQVYHHVVVMYQTWSWLAFDFALGIWGTITNSLVHVVMYYFFYLGSQGHRVSWKNLVTQIQLVQFLFSFGLYGVYLYLHFYGGGCKALQASILSVAFNVSLFVLFNNLLSRNKKRGGAPADAAVAKKST
jgi:hypothetical protein